MDEKTEIKLFTLDSIAFEEKVRRYREHGFPMEREVAIALTKVVQEINFLIDEVELEQSPKHNKENIQDKTSPKQNQKGKSKPKTPPFANKHPENQPGCSKSHNNSPKANSDKNNPSSKNSVSPKTELNAQKDKAFSPPQQYKHTKKHEPSKHYKKQHSNLDEEGNELSNEGKKSKKKTHRKPKQPVKTNPTFVIVNNLPPNFDMKTIPLIKDNCPGLKEIRSNYTVKMVADT